MELVSSRRNIVELTAVLKFVFSLFFHFLNVFNPLADEIKNPGLVWESVGGQPAVAGLPGWGLAAAALWVGEDVMSVCK